MAILRVSNRKSYLSFLLDEIAVIKAGCVVFPCRDELIIKRLRDCLDDLYITNTVHEDSIGRPIVVTDELDLAAKVCFALSDFNKRDRLELTLRMNEIEIDRDEHDLDVDQSGWIAACMDLKMKIYGLPRPRLLIRSNKKNLIESLRERLMMLGIETRMFRSKSYLSVSIGKRASIRKVLNLIPVYIRLEDELSRLISSFDNDSDKS